MRIRRVADFVHGVFEAARAFNPYEPFPRRTPAEPLADNLPAPSTTTNGIDWSAVVVVRTQERTVLQGRDEIVQALRSREDAPAELDAEALDDVAEELRVEPPHGQGYVLIVTRLGARVEVEPIEALEREVQRGRATWDAT
jgi:hypothetical protein